MTDPTDARDALTDLRAVLAGKLGANSDELLEWVRAVTELLTPGVLAIALERRRQITDEGYTPEYDRGHADALFSAAGRYADLAGLIQSSTYAAAALPVVVNPDIPIPFGWPWEAGTWKPSTDPQKNARRAGAMLAAGIDSLVADEQNQES